jgi:hypothetical protein
MVFGKKVAARLTVASMKHGKTFWRLPSGNFMRSCGLAKPHFRFASLLKDATSSDVKTLDGALVTG